MTRSSRWMMSNPDASPPEGGPAGTGEPETRLYSDGAFPGVKRPVVAPVDSAAERIPGTPYLDPTTQDIAGAFRATSTDVEAFRTTFSRASVPDCGGRYHDMGTTALLDMYSLKHPNGAVQAAASPYWAFVWPRDNSYVVVAFALTGLYEEAWAALRYVYSVQQPDGQWEARYLPDGSGDVPDERGRQDDGIGYTLWATWVLTRLSPRELIHQQLPYISDSIRRAVRDASDVLDSETHLPRASQDFWEVDQEEPSLGVSGPLLCGLRAGADLAKWLGDHFLAQQAQEHAKKLLTAIERTFGATGFERFPSGGGRDASLAFLLPPFLGPVDAGAHPAVAHAYQAWGLSRARMQVPNGGLRPGEKWPDATTAWNTIASLYAITAASSGERGIADQYLTWMDERRTRLGCLPEKVTAAGRPAAVAPISTVSACVLIALSILDGYELPIPWEERVSP